MKKNMLLWPCLTILITFLPCSCTTLPWSSGLKFGNLDYLWNQPECDQFYSLHMLSTDLDFSSSVPWRFPWACSRPQPSRTFIVILALGVLRLCQVQVHVPVLELRACVLCSVLSMISAGFDILEKEAAWFKHRKAEKRPAWQRE